MRADTTELIARAVIRRDGHILLARQRDTAWSFLPGGHVEPGERVEAALLRELVEELGADGTITGFLGVVEHGYVAAGVTHHEVNLVFEVAAGGALVGQEDHLIFHWLPLDRLAGADVRPEALKTALLAGGAPFWRPWGG